jgi:3-isopropylmalate/(R)-2-methylmalate dehydratase large subunit
MDSPADREAAERALAYMDLRPGTPMTEIPLDRDLHRLLHELADLRPARGAGLLDGRKIASSLRGMVVPARSR